MIPDRPVRGVFAHPTVSRFTIVIALALSIARIVSCAPPSSGRGAARGMPGGGRAARGTVVGRAESLASEHGDL